MCHQIIKASPNAPGVLTLKAPNDCCRSKSQELSFCQPSSPLVVRQAVEHGRYVQMGLLIHTYASTMIM